MQWSRKDASVNVVGSYAQKVLIEHFYEAKKLLSLRGSNSIVVTSGNDSEHRSGSLHYEDRALDFRVWDLTYVERVFMVRYLNRKYPDEDWIDEEDHIHGEIDFVFPEEV